MQEEIKNLVQNIEKPNYKFIKKRGIRLYFTTNTQDLDQAVLILQEEIKKLPEASVIFFAVTVE